ncbi:hypothetical protein ACFFK0_04305 [Paenibacillus chartarius]|uniref:Uncharacterized protein n=1 Tax=Paenibacillus chartarius TaxID=747481 RepID=A0ABV6DGF3_9BACL
MNVFAWIGWFDFPQSFDTNEWTILLLTAGGWTAVLRWGRHFPRSLLMLLLSAGLMSAMTLDLMLAGPPLDMYDMNDTNKVEWFDLLLYLAYPPFGFLFLYLYTRLQLSGFFTLMYILVWSTGGVLVEWITYEAGVFHYKTWDMWHSLTVYLIVQAAYLYLFRYSRRWYLRSSSQLRQRF